MSKDRIESNENDHGHERDPREFVVVIPRQPEPHEEREDKWPLRIHVRGTDGFAAVTRRAKHEAMEQSLRTPPVLIDAPEAARLLGISVDALYMRISRGQVPGVVKTGRRTQFHRERLLTSLAKRASR